MPPPPVAAAGQLDFNPVFFSVLFQPYSCCKPLSDIAGLHLLQERESKTLPSSLFWPLHKINACHPPAFEINTTNLGVGGWWCVCVCSGQGEAHRWYYLCILQVFSSCHRLWPLEHVLLRGWLSARFRMQLKNEPSEGRQVSPVHHAEFQEHRTHTEFCPRIKMEFLNWNLKCILAPF